MHTEPVSARGASPLPAAHPREYLCFRLGADEYGIDILKVQEIRAYEPPTRIANSPPCIKGVINLRGAIVPVADLRLRFGAASAGCDRSTMTVVLNIGGRVIGIVVDSVSEVVELAAEPLRGAPGKREAFGQAHLIGQATIGDRTLTLLDIERLILSPEMAIAA